MMIKNQSISIQTGNDCFIIMPITDTDGYDKGHFKKVYEDIFKVACCKAGFNAIRADEVKQTNLIHLDILQKLIESPMAICDLSNRNPNVLVELGLRQAFDKPTVLVQEMGTPKIFDISPLRYTEYRKELKYREVLEDQDFIADALKATKDATDKGEGINSIVSLLSLSSPASLKEVTDSDATKMMQIIMAEMNDLKTDFRRTMRGVDEKDRGINDILNHYGAEFADVRYQINKLKQMLSEGAPLDAIKEYHSNLQHNLMYLSRRFKDMKSSAKYRRTIEMMREADSLISQGVSAEK